MANFQSSMSTAVVFSNQTHDLFVLDIPRSLELGNGGGCIHAADAPNEPYETPEPKGKKREAFIAALPAKQVEYHEVLQQDIRYALQALRNLHGLTEWSFPRRVSSRMGQEDRLHDVAAHVDTERREPLPIILSTLPNLFPSKESVSHQVVLNRNMHPTHMRLSDEIQILVPAMCSFLWTDVCYGFDILQGCTIGADLRFDMILMDPPWSNRSVRNGDKYSTIERQVSDPFASTLPIIERYGTSDAHVAVWITNKAAVHNKVLTSLAYLGFGLIEEWIWVKVTTKGEPITPLDGVWRRPYETLLLFHRGSYSSTPMRRYVFAVPDVHSRKPNLKELFSKFIHSEKVLEIFARNLTSGWWCIGDEVLRFQHQDTWHSWPQSVGIHGP